MRLSLAGMIGIGISVVACTPARQEAPVGTSSSRLVGGSTETGHPAVVVFEATGDDGGECTAEFISTTVLVTAAHCVLTEQFKPLTGSSFRIFQGNDFNDAKEDDWITIDPKNVHAHPSFKGEENDIAVLVLSKAIDVKPLAFSKKALSDSNVGNAVNLIGYGATTGVESDNDGFGLKRHLATKIVSVDDDFLEVGKKGATACGGDSGGPAIATVDGVETIIGLDSFSDAEQDCTGTEFYQRIDVQADFIAQFMTAGADTDTSSTGETNSDDTGTTAKPGDGDDDDDSGDDDDDSSKKTKKSDDGASTPAAAGGCNSTGGGAGASLWPLVLLGLVMGRRRSKHLSAKG